jgi:hypothetical protein
MSQPAVIVLGTPAPAKKNCRDCGDAGQLVPADRVLNGGTPVCDRHFRLRLRMPAIPQGNQNQPGKELPVNKNIDWKAVQRDRDAGIPVAELEKKYGVSNPTIYTRTHGSSAKSNGNGDAGGGETKADAQLEIREWNEWIRDVQRRLKHRRPFGRAAREA